jgi:hypothetical protein
MHISVRGRVAAIVAAATFVGAVGAAASPAMAAGTFSCTGTGLRIGSSATSVANPAGTPCATDAKIPVNVPVPLGPLGGVFAIGVVGATQANNATIPGLGHGGNSQGGLLGVTVRLGTLTLTVGAVRSLQYVACPTGDLGPGTPPPDIGTLENSDTVGIGINGTQLHISSPITLPLGIATVYINRTIRVGTTQTRRAVEIQSPLLPAGGIVIGESVVGYTGNPCTAS